ncbi:hypothetical protein TW85_25170, partial [Marinomonas sp. S3726]|uniref:RHS repeat-associated core domain-containing protein n=1 Tax=Marinomonas sp. S3726 TaxID=579484 RepID=UPI0005F9D1F7
DSFGLTGRQGFTGHEMLDNVGLIHMNGRVYDPELGRFVSADPKVPDPFNSQAFNRYTYVYNNPLSFTDPDGFSPKSGDDSSSSDFGFGWGDLASFAVGFTPAGIAADVYGAVTGEDLFTGEKLTPWERATNVIPGASEARKIGKAAKAVQEAAEKLAKKEADAKKAPGPKGKESGNGKDSKDPKDTKRSADGRLRNADGTFAYDSGPKNRSLNSSHGNTKTPDTEATLYGKFDANGNFEKWGISKDASTRYTPKELAGGRIKEYRRGPRDKMLDRERRLVERFPGPKNNEPWAGSKQPK